MNKGQAVRVTSHWHKALVGLEGVLTEKSKYNGYIFYKVSATNDGPKFNKLNLAWIKGNQTWIREDYLSAVNLGV